MKKKYQDSEFGARVRYIMDVEELSAEGFAAAFDIGYTTLNNYLKGTTEANLGLIVSILRKFDWISPAWFVLGEGSPHRLEGVNTAVSDDKVSYVNKNTYASTNADEKMVVITQSELQLLRDALKDKELIIKLLSD